MWILHNKSHILSLLQFLDEPIFQWHAIFARMNILSLTPTAAETPVCGEDFHVQSLINSKMESQNIILPPSLRSEDISEIKNTFIVFAGSEDGRVALVCFYWVAKLSVAEFKKTVDNMEEREKSLLILQLLDDMLALNVDEIDLDTFQQLITAESVDILVVVDL